VSQASINVSSQCSRHPEVATSLRCARCERAFCRDCLVSRFITSRSAVWLCRRCAGIRTGERYGLPSGGGLIRHRRSAGGRGLGYWLAALGVAAVVLVAALQQGLLW